MRFIPLFIFLLTLAQTNAADPVGFLANYCVDCHGETKQKGDRRFDQLTFPLTDVQGIIATQEIIDQLTLGDMPPEKAKTHPDSATNIAAIDAFTAAITTARESIKSTGGQTILRRLNRREYRNTIGDLFDLDTTSWDPTTKFPTDRLSEHMDNIGDTLVTSGYLLDQYLDAADEIVEKALGPFQQPKERSWHFTDDFQQGAELQYSHRSVYKFKFLCVYEVPNTERHEGGYAYIHELQKGVPEDGNYEIQVLAQSVNRDHPYDPAIFGMDPAEPYRLGIVPGDIKVGILHHPQPIEPQLAEVTVQDGEPQWQTMNIFLHKGQTPRFIFPNGMANCRGAFGRIVKLYNDHWPKEERKNTGIFEARRVVLKYGKMPHIRIHEVKVRGPITTEWPPKAQQPLTDFTNHAYRRSATAEEIDQLMRVHTTRRESGATPRQALKDAVKAALCSPAFLYLSETGETLSPHDLASRLSYFLWATMPDAELRALADKGTLTQPEILDQQFTRLLADPRSENFITGFLDSWLNLRALSDMPPDRDMFKTYYSKDLQSAMRKEIELFTRHLITEDSPITDFLDADYTFANGPLAKHYELDTSFTPANAHQFQKVAINNPRRGGLLGMGGVLTVTANGIETSPVNRGVWFLENILGTPPPPPPDNVPPIDPDIRGTTTVRDQLSKHRESPACYSCHQKIDPPGFALENFDPVGAWRTHYPIGRKKRGPKVDASGEDFQDIIGFKKRLQEKEQLFARNLTMRLLSYATGRRIEDALDRPEVDQILTTLKSEGNGLRTLLKKCIQSQIFHSH
jgi:hypothetical protein